MQERWKGHPILRKPQKKLKCYYGWSRAAHPLQTFLHIKKVKKESHKSTDATRIFLVNFVSHIEVPARYRFYLWTARKSSIQHFGRWYLVPMQEDVQLWQDNEDIMIAYSKVLKRGNMNFSHFHRFNCKTGNLGESCKFIIDLLFPNSVYQISWSIKNSL